MTGEERCLAGREKISPQSSPASSSLREPPSPSESASSFAGPRRRLQAAGGKGSMSLSRPVTELWVSVGDFTLASDMVFIDPGWSAPASSPKGFMVKFSKCGDVGIALFFFFSFVFFFLFEPQRS